MNSGVRVSPTCTWYLSPAPHASRRYVCTHTVTQKRTWKQRGARCCGSVPIARLIPHLPYLPDKGRRRRSRNRKDWSEDQRPPRSRRRPPGEEWALRAAVALAEDGRRQQQLRPRTLLPRGASQLGGRRTVTSHTQRATTDPGGSRARQPAQYGEGPGD